VVPPLFADNWPTLRSDRCLWARPRRRVAPLGRVGASGATWANCGAMGGVLSHGPAHRYGRRREVRDGEICPTASWDRTLPDATDFRKDFLARTSGLQAW